MNLDKLYQQTILDYSSRKDLKYEIENPDFAERGHNASCGDDLILLANIKDDIVDEISFIGNGCAISTASTAMLIDLVKGSSVDEAKEKLDIFFRMMKKEELTDDELDKIGDAALLESTANLPARIKCATLSWHTLSVIFQKNEQAN